MKPGFGRDGRGRAAVAGNLSLYITGIVFWGMTLAGLLIAVTAMRSWDAGLNARVRAEAVNAELAIRDALARVPAERPQGTSPAPGFLAAARTQSGLAAIELAGPRGTWRTGTPDGGTPVRRTITVRDANGVPERYRLALYTPDEQSVIDARHKHVLLFTGLVAMVFGFVLQYILQRILTRPFLRMVETAERIADGEKQARFSDESDNEFGFLAGFINQALDAGRRSEAALVQEKELAEVTLRSIKDAVIATDPGGRIRFMNPVAERLTGLANDDVRDRRFGDRLAFFDELSRAPMPDPVAECLRTGETVQLDTGNELLAARTGLEIPVSGTAAPMHNAQGEVIGCVVALQDVRQSREMTHRLSHQASRDSLTGLYNRQSFEGQLKALLEEGGDRDCQHALFYLDLDQFKIVNDTGGHVAGDELLRQLCDVLHSCFRHDDVVARLGGDEFGVLLKCCPPEQAIQVAEKLVGCFEKFRFTWGNNVFQVGVSVGLVPFRLGETDLASLLSASDMACYAAKEAGGNRIHVYAPTDDVLATRQGEMRWATYLTKALEEDLFELFLQPIVALDERDSPRHWEVLLRLPSENRRGHTSPGSFMAAAERFGLMQRIDHWVIAHTFHRFAKMLECIESSKDVFAINLSGASLGDPGLSDFIRSVQAETGVPWTNICFEITETVAIRNLAMAKRFIEELRVLGCRFSLDDFGSGLSSFAYLKNLPVDFLKIDGVFIRDLDKDPVDRAMVDAILQVGRIMGIRTIAEWVENAKIAEVLRDIGVDYAQGYHFGRPAPLERCVCLPQKQRAQ